MVVHCMSIDLEGFCEGMAEAFPVPASRIGSAAERREIAANVDEILAWLDGRGVKTTFFTLGAIAEALPRVVRQIADAGHEVASHGYQHLRLYDLKPADARRAIDRSRQVLEDCTGQRVYGFRAPDFSITRQNLDLLDAVQAAGYSYDSSISPISYHDVYGVAGAAREIHLLPGGLVEFPPATVKIRGLVLPVLGGGYFRLTPLWISRVVMAAKQRSGQPVMSYTHPYELGSQCPRLAGLSVMRRFRHYVNIDRSMARFDALMDRFAFGRAIDILTKSGLTRTGIDLPPRSPTAHVGGTVGARLLFL
jgi:polysaccharide deacetylase family protein (PEP-CTERM system associated)